MEFKSKTPIASLVAELQKMTQEALEDAAEDLMCIGEQAVNAARLNGTYTDRTGNLRSSVGYVLAKDGKVISQSDFAKVIGKDNPDGKPVDGDEQGKAFAASRAAELSKDGFGLVIVAGMEYASYVSDRGYDVLDSAKLRADEQFRQIFGSETTMKSRDE